MMENDKNYTKVENVFALIVYVLTIIYLLKK